MTTDSALSCPKCRRTLEVHSWHDASSGTCRRCETAFEFLAFPALTAAPAKIAAEAVVVAEDSVCFFHAENRAAAVCDGCGRFLCTVCAVPVGTQKFCPSCLAAAKKSEATNVVQERTLFDSLALTTAFVPVLLWFLSPITAPLTLGLVIYGWNKPGGITRGRGRVRFVVAGIFALLQIVGWIILLVFFWRKRM